MARSVTPRRRAILETAARLATVEGLDGLSIGRLAGHMGMSKSGLYAHFGSKEELQLATIDVAGEIFEAEVVAASRTAETPLAAPTALCESFLSHVERKVFRAQLERARAAVRARLEASRS